MNFGTDIWSAIVRRDRSLVNGSIVDLDYFALEKSIEQLQANRVWARIACFFLALNGRATYYLQAFQQVQRPDPRPCSGKSKQAVVNNASLTKDFSRNFGG